MAIIGCENCVFGKRPKVGPKGPIDSPIVIVGESPGWEEVKEGIPFFGPSGSILDACIPKGSPEPYVTNAHLCYPGKKKDQSKLAAACRKCHNRLVEEIKAYPRKLILALGNGAMWSLTKNYNLKITQERGKIFESELARRGILVTIHPAFLLRGGGSFRKFRSDVRYAFDLTQGGRERMPKPSTYRLIEDHEDIQLLMYLMKTQNYVAADIETTGFDHRKDRVLCLGMSFDGMTTYVIPECILAHFESKFKEIFNLRSARWIWHNGKFDVKFLMYKYGFNARVDEDTMLLSYCIDENHGLHDLEQIGNDVIGAPDYKHMLDKYLKDKDSTYEDVPEPILWTYLGLDCSNTRQVFTILREEVRQDARSNLLYTKMLVPASEMLSQVEMNGFPVDDQRVEQNRLRLKREMNWRTNIINWFARKTLGKNINPNSWQQLSELMFDGLKLKAPQRNTQKENLEKITPPHPCIAAILAYKVAAKAHNTYITGPKGIPKNVSDDGCVHATYLIHGTPTGRLACREPNLQNIPRVKFMRGMLVSSDSHKLIEFDLNQAELRSLAALSGDVELCRIYENQELSLHEEMSITLWGEDWPERYAHPNKNGLIFEEAYEEYMKTKAVNFGIVYGREAYSLSMAFQIPLSVAQGWIDAWFNRFPQAHEFILKCRSDAVKGRTLVTVFGRKRRFGVVTPMNAHEVMNKAANFPHQSIASDITLYTAIKIWRTLLSWGVRIVNLVHDSIIVDCPDDPALIAKVKKYVIEEMERTPIEWGITRIPFLCEAEVGDRWGMLVDEDLAEAA